VTLRTIEEEDLNFMQKAINDRGVRQAIGRPKPVNGVQEQEFFEEVICGEDSVSLLVTVEETRVGTVSISDIDVQTNSGEIGYWIAPDHQTQGYGSGAVALLVDYAFRELGLHRVEARVFEFNEASQRLLESVGFTAEGAKRDGFFAHGEYQDVHWYGVLETEWNGI
jgi:ribosomal-protein-alanine N-acetyltransferase